MRDLDEIIIIKKMEDTRDIFEGRVTQSYRFTFQISSGTYILRRADKHDVLDNS